jgi:hypothetical protein
MPQPSDDYLAFTDPPMPGDPPVCGFCEFRHKPKEACPGGY